MELLYIWIEDYFVLKNIGFNFSNRYSVNLGINLEEHKVNLGINENENFIKGFFPGNVVSISAIVGENGVGKSTLLDFIVRINHKPENLNFVKQAYIIFLASKLSASNTIL